MKPNAISTAASGIASRPHAPWELSGGGAVTAAEAVGAGIGGAALPGGPIASCWLTVVPFFESFVTRRFNRWHYPYT
jgi:hypothetical protein